MWPCLCHCHCRCRCPCRSLRRCQGLSLSGRVSCRRVLRPRTAPSSRCDHTNITLVCLTPVCAGTWPMSSSASEPRQRPTTVPPQSLIVCHCTISGSARFGRGKEHDVPALSQPFYNTTYTLYMSTIRPPDDCHTCGPRSLRAAVQGLLCIVHRRHRTRTLLRLCRSSGIISLCWPAYAPLRQDCRVGTSIWRSQPASARRRHLSRFQCDM